MSEQSHYHGMDMLINTADYITFDLLGLTPGTHLGEALNFFLYLFNAIL
jgi:hypothetical protein